MKNKTVSTIALAGLALVFTGCSTNGSYFFEATGDATREALQKGGAVMMAEPHSGAQECINRRFDRLAEQAEKENKRISIQGAEFENLKNSCLKAFPGSSLGYYEGAKSINANPPIHIVIPNDSTKYERYPILIAPKPVEL